MSKKKEIYKIETTEQKGSDHTTQGKAKYKPGSTTQGGSNYGQGSAELGTKAYKQGQKKNEGSNYDNEKGYNEQ
ncbi:MAG: hypothetical protein P4L41_01770 [Flavipsychrobacter sp.]|nr:hypothetical protein [Flavipsychrobacter sp.]